MNFASPVLQEIGSLDPVRDHQRIAFLSSRVDFPFDTTRALEFALFRTFCVPAIGGLLDRTGEFGRRPQKRYDDTDLLVSELMEHGYDSDRGRAAIARMNALHGRFQIANDDFRYVLSTFVFEPIRWNTRFGWRRLTAAERTAWFHFWREVGLRMHLRELPTDYAEFEQFNVDYEREHFRFTAANQRVGAATVGMFVSWFPRPLAPLVRRVIYALLDDALLNAFGFPRQPEWLRGAVGFSLRARGRLLRLIPRRKRPVLRTEQAHRTYPAGYDLASLGPTEAETAAALRRK